MKWCDLSHRAQLQRTLKMASTAAPVPLRLRGMQEQAAADQRLEQEGRFLSAVLETAGGLVVVLDTDGRIVRFNHTCEQVSGYGREAVMGKRLWDLVIPEEEVDGVREVFSDLVAGDFPSEYENHWCSKDGTRRLISWKNTALLDEEGRVQFVVATGLDMTDRRQLEDELVQAQKMDAVGRLAGGIAHDFNNILLAVAGRAERLLSRVPANDAIARDVEEIARAADRGAALTRQLLTFSRRESRELRVLDLNQLIEELRGMLRPLIGEDVEVTPELEKDLGRVQVDRAQIEQIIMNLAVNARDAMPKGGRLTIETHNRDLTEPEVSSQRRERRRSWVELTVRDTGIGMDEETRKRAFQPFFTTKEPDKGTGLGLSTAYGIVKQSGGEIRIESQPGKGTAVRIFLPRVESSCEPPEAEATPTPVSTLGSETILLVEDDTPARELLEEYLEEQGFNVLSAVDGEEALKIFHRQPDAVDAVITDWVMPGMPGPDLAKRIQRTRPDTRILLMSGYTERGGPTRDPDVRLKLLRKPFALRDLSTTLRGLLDSAVDG